MRSVLIGLVVLLVGCSQPAGPAATSDASLVYLLKSARAYDPHLMHQAVEQAYQQPGTFQEVTPESTRITLEGGQVVIVRHAAGAYPATPRLLQQVGRHGDARVKELWDHQAGWWAVEAPGPDRLKAFQVVGKLMAQLGSTDVGLIFDPESNQVQAYDSSVVKLLQGEDPRQATTVATLETVRNQAGRDPAMEAAIAEARAHFPDFRKRVEAGAEGEFFYIKMAFPVKGKNASELMWVEVTRLQGDKIEGTLSNDPVEDTGYKYGDPVAATVDQVEDWCVSDEQDSTLAGYYTVKF